MGDTFALASDLLLSPSGLTLAAPRTDIRIVCTVRGDITLLARSTILEAFVNIPQSSLKHSESKHFN